MKKRFFIAGGLSLLAVFILTGCGASDQFRSWFRQQLLERSGIKADENYIQAEENRQAGLLDEEGRFIIQAGSEEPLSAAAGMQGDGGSLAAGNDADTAEAGERGAVHVTFAENTNLRIAYFLDEGHTMPVVGRDVYLNPGDAVYYENTGVQSMISDQYYFSGFRCYEYCSDGMRKDFVPETDAVLGLTYDAEEVQTLTPGTGEAQNSALGKIELGGVLRIPADFTGTEVSVEPVGKYVPRAI